MIFTQEVYNALIDRLNRRYLIYRDSFHIKDNRIFFLCRKNIEKLFGEVSLKNDFIFSGPKEEIIEMELNDGRIYTGLFAASIDNSKKLLSFFPELKPKRIDKKLSAGFGDRVGIAAAAHVKISQKYDFFPLFAQQSAREITKTSRDCETVLHNAVLGIFQEGYGNSWGSDADHIRDKNWLNTMINNTYLPYTMFTIDTYDYVNTDNESSPDSFAEDKKLKERLEKSKKYIGKSFYFSGNIFSFTDENIYSMVIRYYKSLDFLSECYNLIKSKISDFDFEPTFDERDIDTTPLEHFYIASELINDGVIFSTIAPKFPGLFEKGIDYIGNLNDFIISLRVHGEIAKYFGNYRLSVHSADDKFMIFKYLPEILGENFHIKTSGTTWMESLRTIAEFNPDLFKKIINIVLAEAEANSKDYYIALDYKKINTDLKSKKLTELIDIKETRQLLHVSYGTVLNEYRREIVTTLYEHEEVYMKNIIKNYQDHFEAIFGK